MKIMRFNDSAEAPGLVGATIDRAHLRQGERVLIHGGAGAVGLFAVQLAHRIDAYLITTAASEHFEFVRQLGAQEVIDYRIEQFQKVAKNVDDEDD